MVKAGGSGFYFSNRNHIVLFALVKNDTISFIVRGYFYGASKTHRA